MPYIKNLRLKDLLIAAGGLTSDAESGRIEIASLVDSADNYELKIKKVTTWKTILINPNLIKEINERIEKFCAMGVTEEIE